MATVKENQAVLSSFLLNLEKKGDTSLVKSYTVKRMLKETNISSSTLYKYHKKEIAEFKSIKKSCGDSSYRKLLGASRKENKILRQRNSTLTAIAHEYFIQNESLKQKIIMLNKKMIKRIK